jgi:hypothetical protein
VELATASVLPLKNARLLRLKSQIKAAISSLLVPAV